MTINHKTVAKLMKEMGLSCQVRKKKYSAFKAHMAATKAPNILNRDFHAEAPDRKWVTDVTEFNIQGKKIFLSVLLDLFNREVRAYSIDNRPSFKLVQDMMKDALNTFDDCRGLLIHSDQGWQYHHKEYVKLLRNRGFTQSMSRKATCLDNAVIESFFAILKSEFYYLQEFTSVEEFINELNDYIYYYNHIRISERLNGLTPVLFRALHTYSS